MEIKLPDGIWAGFLTWLYKQGVTTVLLVGFAAFMGFYVIIPSQQDQKRYVDALISTQERYVKSFELLVLSHQEATQKLGSIATAQEKLSNIQESANNKLDSILKVQEQLRDDTRSGAWTRPKNQPGVPNQ